MKILVINCGSSSLKYQLIDMDGEKVLCKGLCERIGMESSMITHEANGTKAKSISSCRNHRSQCGSMSTQTPCLSTNSIVSAVSFNILCALFASCNILSMSVFY